MGPEGGEIGGLVVAEPGVPHQLEGQFFGRAAQNAPVKLSDLQHQGLKQLLKCGVGLCAALLVGVKPLPVVVLLQIGQKVQNEPCIHGLAHPKNL